MRARYVNPKALVDSTWIAEHRDDPSVRLVEVSASRHGYDAGHITGAVGWDWKTDLQDSRTLDIASRESLERLLGRSGIRPEMSIVLYGDADNSYAAYAYWVLRQSGHRDLRLLNGSKRGWAVECGEWTAMVHRYPATDYRFDDRHRYDLRAGRDHVMDRIGHSTLVDVRSAPEYHGELVAPEGQDQTGVQRAGRIPSAVHVPWTRALDGEGRFCSATRLRETYSGAGLVQSRDVIVYCRSGKRSAHTWFVLAELLAYPSVRNYDGSWMEWGNLVSAPIEIGRVCEPAAAQQPPDGCPTPTLAESP
jgi:thiosulfate/3-mercaptopyruvate sulfurtransferase